jgi:hypothetical protein
LSFEEALAAEPERIAGEEERLLNDPTYQGRSHRYHSYRTRGLYLEQLERWWAVVPSGRLLVLRSEDMFADPAAVYRELTGFLGLESDERRTFDARNRVDYGGMAQDTRRELEQYYAEPNRRLEARLGRTLGW